MKSIVRRTLHKISRPKFVHVLVLTRALVGALLLMGCVSQGAYEEVKSARDREALERAQSQLLLAEKEQEAARLDEESRALKAALSRQEELYANLENDKSRLENERDLNQLLVAQLQSELARVTEHLRALTTEQEFRGMEKQKLLAELDEANREVVRLGAQVESLLIETREKNQLEKQLAETLSALSAMKSDAAIRDAERIKTTPRSKRSG